MTSLRPSRKSICQRKLLTLMEMSIMAMLPIRCVLLSFFFMTPLEPSTLPGRSCSLWALFVLQLESVFEVRRGLQWVQYPSGTFLFFCFYSLEAMDFLFHFHSWTVYWSIRSVFRSRLALFVKIWRSWRQLLLSILQRPFLGYLLSDTKESHSWCSNKVFFNELIRHVEQKEFWRKLLQVWNSNWNNIQNNALSVVLQVWWLSLSPSSSCCFAIW